MGSYTDDEIEIMIRMTGAPHAETEKDLRRHVKKKNSINRSLNKMVNRGLLRKRKGKLNGKSTNFYSATKLTERKVTKWSKY